MARLASIDIGTNTLRLLIAEINNAPGFRELYSENKITRLGEGFSDEKNLSPAAINRTLSTLNSFRALLEKEKIDQCVVTGTSAVREAKNKAYFLEKLTQETGFKMTVLSGEEEARLTLLGVSLLFKDRNKAMVVIDIGGGSTELIATHPIGPPLFLSTNLGTVTLCETHLPSDPPSAVEIKALKNTIETHLAKIKISFQPQCLFVGTAGTLTTLAAIDQKMTQYNPEQINGYRLSFARIEQIVNKLARLPIHKRRSIPGLEKGREDLIVSGGFILTSVMERFDYQDVIVSDYGLREGVLINLSQKQSEK